MKIGDLGSDTRKLSVSFNVHTASGVLEGYCGKERLEQDRKKIKTKLKGETS